MTFSIVARCPRTGMLGVATSSKALAAGAAVPWAGALEGGGYVSLGNILVAEDVAQAMAHAFEASEDEDLPERLLRALEAGQDAGRGRRGPPGARTPVGP